MPWLAAEMTRESHLVHCKERSQEHRGKGVGGEGEGGGLVCGKLDQTERTELQGAGRGVVLLTEVTAGRVAPGPGLLTCLCRSGWRPGQGWPSPKVGNSCFDLCWWRGCCSVGKRARLCYRKPGFYWQGHSTPSPHRPPEQARVGKHRLAVPAGARLSE